MSRKHDDVYGALGGDLDPGVEPGAVPRAEPVREQRGGARFLKRTNALGERLAGGVEEKTLLWVDPEDCVMWERHNRAYGLLSEDGCRDLIDAIRAQGRQEFPAVVRAREGEGAPYEVICGARRHFAISWLRRHGYTQFRYLIEVRELTDEEAFRLADVENRNRADISDFERARDYAAALDAYYGGSQKAMAERLEVTQTWLSRYLALARMPGEVVEAFATIRDIREAHARALLPLMRTTQGRGEVVAEARAIAEEQAEARDLQRPPVDPARVIARLRAAVEQPRAKPPRTRVFRRDPAEGGLTVSRHGRTIRMEFREGASRAALEAWLARFVEAEYGDG